MVLGIGRQKASGTVSRLALLVGRKVLLLRDKVIQPLLAAALQPLPTPGAQNPTRLDHHYEALRVGMRGLFQELGIAA